MRMPPSGSEERFPALLDAYPALRAYMESERFRQIEEHKRVEIDGLTHYIVHGDTLGSREELFVDALSRGSSPECADSESRALFLELPPELKDVIRGVTRQDAEDQPSEGALEKGPGG